MNTNTDISQQLKKYISDTDDITAKIILEMLAVKEGSLWFRNEITEDGDEANDIIQQEEKQLTYEQVKQLYPHWFTD